MECDLYRVEQGNRRHFDITAKCKTKPLPDAIAMEEFQSFNKIRSRVECTAEINALVHDNWMASKSSNVCDNYSNKSNMTCDSSNMSERGDNKETLLSCECIVQLSSMDGLSSTQRSCGCQDVEDSSLKHGDNKSTDLLDKMEACSIKRLPPSSRSFVTKQLSLSVSSECVQKLDELVKDFLTGGNRNIVA